MFQIPQKKSLAQRIIGKSLFDVFVFKLKHKLHLSHVV